MLIGIGTPSVRGMDVLSRIRWIESQGFEEIELYCCPCPKSLAGVWLRAISQSDAANIKAALKSFRKADFHAPFQNTFDVSLVSANPWLRKMTIEEISLILEFAGDIGPDSVVTCHSGWATFGATDEETETHLVESLQSLSAKANETGARIGIEVADYFMPADKFVLLEDLNLPQIGITLDTGHISFTKRGQTMYHSFGTIGGFIERFQELLYHIHIHDYDGEMDHKPIGAGGIDFEDVFSALSKTGYQGAVSLELNAAFVSPEEAAESRRRLQNLKDRWRNV